MAWVGVVGEVGVTLTSMCFGSDAVIIVNSKRTEEMIGECCDFLIKYGTLACPITTNHTIKLNVTFIASLPLLLIYLI